MTYLIALFINKYYIFVVRWSHFVKSP